MLQSLFHNHVVNLPNRIGTVHIRHDDIGLSRETDRDEEPIMDMDMDMDMDGDNDVMTSQEQLPVSRNMRQEQCIRHDIYQQHDGKTKLTHTLLQNSIDLG